jgi:4-diphosphocytidyl-2-C-methyl-D-erythritol kinase
MIVYPNAKINIGLNVLEKQVDGYHKISSVFYPVNELFDILEIFPSKDFSFSSSGIEIPGTDNLCIKAFDLLHSDFKIGNVTMHLHKLIPIGAGLGGGSSDGASVLKALNELFKLELSSVELEKYALQLGADCPFFIENLPKYVTGVGENMMSIDFDLSSYKLKFIFPKIHISTIDAYKFVIPNQPKKGLLDLVNQPIENWKRNVKNDFEVAAFLKYPQLNKIKKKLYADKAIYASMTGSGSVIYGVFIS